MTTQLPPGVSLGNSEPGAALSESDWSLLDEDGTEEDKSNASDG